MSSMNLNLGGFDRRAILTALLLVATFFVMLKCHAQSSNQWRFMAATGVLYERGLDATLSVEKETKYHNSWEAFFNGYLKWDDDPDAGHVTKKSFWHNYNTWSVGLAVKPCLSRGRNHHGNLRIGASLGSDTEDFIGIIHLGYEHSYALMGGFELFFQVKEDIAICAKDLFRTGVAIGVKVPLTR